VLKHSFFLCIFYSVLMIYIIFLKCFVSNCVSFLLNLILYFLITRFAVNIINYLSYFLFQFCFKMVNIFSLSVFAESLLLLLSILRFNFKQKCFCLLSQKSHFCCHSLSKTSFLRNRMKSVSCLLCAKTDFL